jgi:hypothetical protein
VLKKILLHSGRDYAAADYRHHLFGSKILTGKEEVL